MIIPIIIMIMWVAVVDREQDDHQLHRWS
jgi:hypothetical protein